MMNPLFLLLFYVVVTSADDCIVGCKCLGNFQITDCQEPIVLTKDTVRDLPKSYVSLQFERTYIKSIENDFFNDFKSIENLVVKHSTIGSISGQALNALKTAKFVNTSIGEIPLVESMKLEALIFDNCKLSKVPAFNMPELTLLNLANNDLKSLEDTAFKDLIALMEIYLSNNTISEIPTNLFASNDDLVKIVLDDNPITSIQLNTTAELEELSLRNCKIFNFDQTSTQQLHTLNALDLSGNQIEVLPIDVFEPMKLLNFLDLSNNKLIELDAEIFAENDQLQTVDLSNNPLSSLPVFETTTEAAFNIERFSCKRCNLTTIHSQNQDSVFVNMANLHSIDLSFNKIKNIDGAFSNLQDLKTVYLSHNNLQSPGVKSFSKALEILDLSHNPLLPLDPVAFADLDNIKQLNISNTNLTELWLNHNAILPRLQVLYLENNDISSITTDDMKVMPKLKVFDVLENPLNCDDTLKELMEFLKLKTINVKPVRDLERIITSSQIERFLLSTPTMQWNQVFKNLCGYELTTEVVTIPEDLDTIDNDVLSKSYEPSVDDDDEDDDDDDDYKEDVEEINEYFDEESKIAKLEDISSLSLAKAYYVLSITAVFILTALVVLIISVAVTLLVLKRNRGLNMKTENLPRFKIPLWNTTSSQKKHSGSVYKPLSEDLSESCNSIINRYEFLENPQVHNSIP